MQKVLKSAHVIRFQDCDPFNHLNNARYLDYFMNAREDQVQEHYNLSIYEYAKESGKGWVVASNQISYVRPATTMESVVIESQLIQFTDKLLLVEMKMWDKSESALKAIMWSKFLQVDIKTGVISSHSAAHMELFGSVLVTVPLISFEERSALIIKESRVARVSS